MQIFKSIRLKLCTQEILTRDIQTRSNLQFLIFYIFIFQSTNLKFLWHLGLYKRHLNWKFQANILITFPVRSLFMKFKGPNSSWGTLLKGHILKTTAHRHLIFFGSLRKVSSYLLKHISWQKECRNLKKKKEKYAWKWIFSLYLEIAIFLPNKYLWPKKLLFSSHISMFLCICIIKSNQ